MKNRYLKGAHISERKVKELLKLFCEDLTATQIAHITGVSRITINAYLKLVRKQIALFTDEQNPTLINNRSSYQFEYLNGNGNVSAQSGTRKPLYGIYRLEDKIYTDEISGLEPEWVHDWLKRKVSADLNDRYQSRLPMYSAIADFNSIKLYRTQFQSALNGKHRIPMDEVDIFWGLLKSRLIKFRGLNVNTLLLHVKETEFRFNNRNRELYDIVLSILNNRPLHLSKTA